MEWDEGNPSHLLSEVLESEEDLTVERCLLAIVNTIGWKWGFVVFSYAWLAFLAVVQGTLIRLFCGKLRPVEQNVVAGAVLGRLWRSFLFLNVVLAPKTIREWLFWVLWFSSTGLLMLLETVGKEHFEQVVDNPRFGVRHTLRVLSLHAVVLYLSFVLAEAGWDEFSKWGEGPIGRVLLSPSWASALGAEIHDDFSVGGARIIDGRYTYFGWTSAPLSSPSPSSLTDTERGGTGFALLLLYDVAITGTEVGLSAIKYIANLFDLHRDADSAYAEETSTEQITFFTRIGQAIMNAGRTIYMFKSCGHCCLTRKVVIRLVTVINGAHAVKLIHRAAWRVILAKEMDVAFPDATEKELKSMASDESCAICLKTMTSAKKLDCQHFFHTSCLRQYLKNTAGSEPLCPICRAPIPWHPSTGSVKPHILQEGRARNTPAATAAARGGENSDVSVTAAMVGDRGGNDNNNNHDSNNHNNETVNGTVNSLEFGPAVHRPPTPDGFSRAAREADSVVRLVRQVLRFGWMALGGAGGGVEGGGSRTRRRDAGNGRDPPPSPSSGETTETQGATGGGLAERASGAAGVARAAARADGRGGPGLRSGSGGGDFETVAQQLMEIFPDMGWDAALGAARMAGGSAEQAVEYALSSEQSESFGVGGGLGGGGPGRQRQQREEERSGGREESTRDDHGFGVRSLTFRVTGGAGEGSRVGGGAPGSWLRRR